MRHDPSSSWRGILVLALAWSGVIPAATGAEPAKPQAVPPLVLDIASDRGSAPVYREGEEMTVMVQASTATNIACFHQDGGGGIIRIFPNRHQPSPAIGAQVPQQIPGQGMRIRLERGLTVAAIRCFATQSPPALSAPLGPDLEPLRVQDLDTLTRIFSSQAPDSIVATMVVATTK